MSIHENQQPATSTLKAYIGNPRGESDHVLHLAPGRDEVDWECILCGATIALSVPHLELFQKSEPTTDGDPICLECARASEEGWQKNITACLLNKLIKCVKTIPTPCTSHFLMDSNCLHLDLLITVNIASMAMYGVEIKPDAMEFVRKGGVVDSEFFGRAIPEIMAAATP